MVGGTELPTDWLAFIIDRLPSLQSLIIHDLSSFDHIALQALNNILTPLATDARRLTSSLRLLTASLSRNAVSSSLSGALDCLPTLIYLDLSSTSAANDPLFLEHIASATNFPSLEILKLRNIGLGNGGLWWIAVGLGTRVWSLDIRQNRLTDSVVPTLIERCFLPGNHVSHDDYHDEQMDIMSGVGPKDDEFSVVRRLAKSAPLRRHPAGITHLYISDNDLTVESAKLLIRAWRLVALDFGKLKLGERASRDTPQIYRDASAANEFRILLHRQMIDGARLRYLRVDHTFVTGDAWLLDRGINAAEEAWNFWPSGNGDFVDGKLVYDMNFPGLGFHTLVLVGLPSISAKGWITKTLLAFLSKCSDMEKDIRDDPRAFDVGGHSSSILQELHLETPDSFDSDQPESNLAAPGFLERVDEDFSFFREEPLEGALDTPQVAAPTVEDEYEGEIVHKLKLLKATTPWSWSGKIAVVRPLRPEERSPPVPRCPEHYTLI